MLPTVKHCSKPRRKKEKPMHQDHFKKDNLKNLLISLADFVLPCMTYRSPKLSFKLNFLKTGIFP